MPVLLGSDGTLGWGAAVESGMHTGKTLNVNDKCWQCFWLSCEGIMDLNEDFCKYLRPKKRDGELRVEELHCILCLRWWDYG
jgi:hypothetical protein